MTSITQTAPPAMSTSTPTLEDFFQRVRESNPFEVNRVVASTVLRADVTGIHETAFNLLLELAGKTQQQHTGIGAMLLRFAGKFK